jgi:predicted Zn-dependent protease
MNGMKTRLRGRAIAAFCISAAAAFAWATPARADQRQDQWETQIGRQQYAQLAQKGEIVPSSPYYSVLEPIAERIAKVANAQYFAPFHFILVNERSPNAFSVPGGNVYVTTSMMSFAKNQDELAGVLCHEVSHDIHHDVYNNANKDQHLQMAAGVLGMLMGNNLLGQMALGLGAGAQAMTYSRSVESNADKAGAYTCAQAGFNPYGMVWLFKRFQANPGNNGGKFEMLSDHPRDDHRIADLESLFRSDPTSFAHFSADESKATPLPAPSALPQQQQQGYPQQQQQQQRGYPSQQQQGYPPQQPGYPPQQQGYPPQQQGYPPQQQGYPPQQPGYPPQQQGYPPQQPGYPPQQQGYPPQQPGYPPQQGYPPA